MRCQAFDKGDGRHRLLFKGQSKRSFNPLTHKIHVHMKSPKCRLINSFSKDRLMKIAWQAGVSNPDGFDRTDATFFGLNNQSAFDWFQTGWDTTSKTILGIYIWNRFHDLDEIVCA